MVLARLRAGVPVTAAPIHLLVLALTLVGAAPAAIAGVIPRQWYYLALGDSLAYGYQPGSPLDRSQGYVARLHRTLDPRVRLADLACVGETTGTMIDGGRCEYPGGRSQLQAAVSFLTEHRATTTLVTIDVGVNDLLPCVDRGRFDAVCVDRRTAKLTANLALISQRLRAAAPETRIVGMNYYNPVLAAWLTGAAGQELARQSVPILKSFNKALSSAYRSGQIPVANVSIGYASEDLSTMVTLPGHGEVPRAVARVCELTLACAEPPGVADHHPTAAGYQVIADAFQARLRWLPCRPCPEP